MYDLDAGNFAVLLDGNDVGFQLGSKETIDRVEGAVRRTDELKIWCPRFCRAAVMYREAAGTPPAALNLDWKALPANNNPTAERSKKWACLALPVLT